MSARFTVTWVPELRDSLAQRWLDSVAHGRKRLTQISNRIDRELKFSPARHGVAVTDRPGFRLWRIPDIEPPILVVFEVRPDDRIVEVVQILLFER